MFQVNDCARGMAIFLANDFAGPGIKAGSIESTGCQTDGVAEAMNDGHGTLSEAFSDRALPVLTVGWCQIFKENHHELQKD